MIPILSPEEAAALDRASAERGVAVESLMDRAGFEVARAATALAGGRYGRRAVVVCGKGNNGGDGLVAARYLATGGMGVTAILTAPGSEFRGAARHNLRRLASTDVRVRAASAGSLPRELGRADVCVDAVFGTGFRGSVSGAAADAIVAMGEFFASGRPVVAVDIPSGVDGATGGVGGPAVRATATVTFGCLKPGLAFLPGAELAGSVLVADIGFPRDLLSSDMAMIEGEDAARLAAPRPVDANKRSIGVVLVIAGSRDMPGASVLASLAAYRAGAGLVTLASVPAAVDVAQRTVVEATYLRLPEAPDGGIGGDAWPAIAQRLASVHAVAVGPGLGRGGETAALVRRVVAESPVPVVLDADGLNAFPGGVGLDRRRSAAVLTPHAGEFSRLTGTPVQDVAGDRPGLTRKAARAFDAVMLLKGFRTVVASPEGHVSVVPTGGPALATGGTGDVLTGAVAAWLARGLAPADAAAVAAFIHGLAGDVAGAEMGEGATAHDVAERLPAVTRALNVRDEGLIPGPGPDGKGTLPMPRRI